jgi:hypothetical protein
MKVHTHNVVCFAEYVTELVSRIFLMWMQYARVFCVLPYSLEENISKSVYIFTFFRSKFTRHLLFQMCSWCVARDVRTRIMWTGVYDITERAEVTREDYGIVLVQGIH